MVSAANHLGGGSRSFRGTEMLRLWPQHDTFIVSQHSAGDEWLNDELSVSERVATRRSAAVRVPLTRFLVPRNDTTL